jgi:hypothetical protein
MATRIALLLATFVSVAAQCVSLVDKGAFYTGDISMGTPPNDVRFEVVPDTGSEDLVVASTLCHTAACKSKTQFNPNHKSYHRTSTQTQQIAYMQGALEVQRGTDEVNLNGKKKTAHMLAVTNENLLYWKEARFDGIMGLGQGSNADFGDTSLLTSLGVHKFGVCLGNGGGRLDLTPMNLNYKGLSVKSHSMWATDLQSFHIGSHTISSPNTAALVDSGTTLMMLPEQTYVDVLFRIEEACGVSCLDNVAENNKCEGHWFSQLPTISMKLGGQTLQMHPSQYMRVMDVSPFLNSRMRPFKYPSYMSGRRCVQLFIGQDTMTNVGQLAILGMPFLRAFATQFDRSSGKMSVAPAPKGSCNGCGGNRERALRESERSLMPSQVAEDEDGVINMDELRLPYYAVPPSLRPAQMGRLMTDGNSTEISDAEWRFIIPP